MPANGEMFDGKSAGQSVVEPSAPAELSSERFSEMVNALKSQHGAEAFGDQRRQPRCDMKARATIIPLRESCHPGALTILVRDLSPAGIGFLYERQMSLDEQFALVLPRLGDTPAIVLCEVACWQPIARHAYAIGARFVRVLRDGGDPALPIEVDPTLQPSVAVLPQVRAKAS